MNNKTTTLLLRKILMFVILMVMSYIPELYPDIFGDWKCQGSKYGKLIPETQISYSFRQLIGCDYADYGVHNPTMHWGYRHWLYLCMGISLFIVQGVDLINPKK